MNTLLILQSHTKVAACDTELHYKRARQMFSTVPRGVIRKKIIYIQQNRLCGFGVSLPFHPHKNFESKKYKRKKDHKICETREENHLHRIRHFLMCFAQRKEALH